jgi:hypothetical protein
MSKLSVENMVWLWIATKEKSRCKVEKHWEMMIFKQQSERIG